MVEPISKQYMDDYIELDRMISEMFDKRKEFEKVARKWCVDNAEIIKHAKFDGLKVLPMTTHVKYDHDIKTTYSNSPCNKAITVSMFMLQNDLFMTVPYTMLCSSEWIADAVKRKAEYDAEQHRVKMERRKEDIRYCWGMFNNTMGEVLPNRMEVGDHA